MILQCSHIQKSFGTDTILSDVSFHINDNEKAAVVGINGSGKSTLLKIIMGEIAADDGEVIFRKDASVGYLAQSHSYKSDKSIWDEMQDANPEIPKLSKRMDSLSRQMENADGGELEKLIKQHDAARHRFESLDGYAYESRLTGVLKGLGFFNDDFTKPVSTLSGGEKTRVALAKMLLKSPDLIILDEPTNHLDLGAISWLEGYLCSYAGAVLVVAHDRYFLDRFATKVVELRQARCTVYQGNYTAYSKKRAELLDAMMKQYMNQQAEIKHQEEVITKLKSFNREKSIKRAESREKMLGKIERLEKPIEDNTRMRLLFSQRTVSGNDVLHAENLSKSYGKTLFSDVGFDIKRGEHVAIIGDNGTGKTTLLKIINGMESPDFGSLRFGTNVCISYYDQEHQVLHPEKTLFDELSDTYPDMNNTKIRNILAAFLFIGEDVFKRVSELSGGERGRISLAKLMLSDANFLLLDEPTNHLDMDSKQILENAVREFEGTILYVSHDRYFINATATRILDLTGETLVNYLGNYDYYLEKRDDAERAVFGNNADTVRETVQNAQRETTGADSSAAGQRETTDADSSAAGQREDGSLTAGWQNSNASTYEPQSGDGAANKRKGEYTSENKRQNDLVSTTSRHGKDSVTTDWQQQKEERRRQRKIENELNRTEERIELLERENAEIDNEMLLTENVTNSLKLRELADKKTSNELELEKLMEQWEEYSNLID